MEMKHSCDCEICNNNIREEMQFAAIKINEELRIVSAEEYAHIDVLIEKGMLEKNADFEEVIVDEENKDSVFVYGVLIPEYEIKKSFEEWEELVRGFIGYAYLTLEDEKQYISLIEDIRLFNESKHYGHIPCVVKLKTDIKFEKEREFGFGHVFSLKYKDMLSVDSIINRDYLLCLRDIKLTEGFEDIDKKRLEKVALELF